VQFLFIILTSPRSIQHNEIIHFSSPAHTISCLSRRHSSCVAGNVLCLSNEKRSFFPRPQSFFFYFFFFIESHIKTDTHWKLLWWHQKFILRNKKKEKKKVRERRRCSYLNLEESFSRFMRLFIYFLSSLHLGLRSSDTNASNEAWTSVHQMEGKQHHRAVLKSSFL
jgi:hypothetical protein